MRGAIIGDIFKYKIIIARRFKKSCTFATLKKRSGSSAG